MKKSQTLSTKTLKSQLVALTAMLLVAAIALGTATYAWFVNSSVASVETMQFQATTSTSLQVAVVKNSSGVTPYKGNVTNADITTEAGWTDMFSTKLTPATASNETLLTNTFFKSNGHMTSEQKMDEFVAAAVGQADVKKIPLSFLASKDMDVYFGSTAFGGTAADLLSTGAGNAIELNGIKTALRIAVSDGENATIFQFAEDNSVVVGASNNTDYNSKVASPEIIQDDATGTYQAVTSVVASAPYKVETVGKQQCVITTDFADYVATVADATNVTAGTTPLFSLTANTAKTVYIYIWLEGTDPGCLSALADYNFAVSLPFAGK